ncbi:UvrD-helicase domain-containing protein [Streptomyces sp. NPDC048723]|uniref:UvrD-helicase domain-containing protein n=1 Tax=Streptomyces sp. NPDC048723 TaxID=3365589 RepID=UPI0037218745
MTIPYEQAAFAKDRVEALASTLGLTLPHQEQWDFLQSMTSLDLQAAPGSGKTSLIGLKLALLAAGWSSRTRGICVLSHTNTAKTEITARLAATPVGRRLLAYPHFIGTIQSFANTFLALPAVRALGVEIQAVDDEAYAAAALRLLERDPRFRTLLGTLDRQRDGRQLAATARFVCEARDLTVVATRSLPFSKETPSGKQFILLKRNLARRGIFRYEDMFAIAEQHLVRNPDLADATSRRFPFVLLDEMQDTSLVQERLLDKVFGSTGTVVQRVGDVNQRIFNDGQPGCTEAGTFPLPMAAELPVSRRFGNRIAGLASELTVHRRQRIHGAGPEGTIVLLTYDESTVAQVVPAFERLAATFVLPPLLQQSPPRVLGARRHRGSSPNFPQSLACYVPELLAQGDAVRGSLIRTTRSAQAQWQSDDSHGAVSHVWNAVRGLVRPVTEGYLPAIGRLEREPVTAGGKARAVLLGMLTGQLDDEALWESLMDQLMCVLSELTSVTEADLKRMGEVFLYVPRGQLPRTLLPTSDETDLVPSIASTIQSAKGETHSATLLLDCLDKTGKKFDVNEVLTLLANGSDLDRATNTVKRAAQLIFVGATRPTHLLAFATPRQRAEPYAEALVARGWSIRDASATS